jgi:uncharacterized membrane protein YdjX (TVP38/TMEM64 family)
LITPQFILHEAYFQQLSMKEWALFYLIACCTMALSLTHTTFIALLSGYFLGWSSVPFVIPSYLLASVAGYYLTKLIDHQKFMNYLLDLPKAPAIASSLKRNEWMVIMLSRLSPALPFAVMNVLLALLNANIKKYILGGLLGMLPRTLIMIWTGIQAKRLVEAFKNPEGLSISEISTIAFLVISIVGLFYYITRAVRKAGIQQ